MVIDVACWCAERLTERTFLFINQHESKLRFAEQYVLNCVPVGLGSSFLAGGISSTAARGN